MKLSPYINYIRSFEASARHLSFTSAAAELNFTQAAISNHVRCLEEFIGRPLFVRHPRSLSLTTLGTAYLPSVQKALNELDEATEGIMTSLHERMVTISCPVSLAQNWLAKAVTRFNEVNPDVTIAIHGNIWASEEDPSADIRLAYARKEEAPAGSELLWPEDLCVICAPDYQVNGKRPKAPEDLRDSHLVHILGRTIFWKQFAEQYGMKDWNILSRTQTNSLNVALELAANGQGCALLPQSLVASHIKRGLLIMPFEIDMQSPWSCYIKTDKSAQTPWVSEVVTWLKSVSKEKMN